MEKGKQGEKGNRALQIGPDLNIYKVTQLREEFMVGLSGHEGLVLKLDEVETCDTAGIQLLLSARKTAINAGKAFQVKSSSSSVLKTLNDMGLDPEDIIETLS